MHAASEFEWELYDKYGLRSKRLIFRGFFVNQNNPLEVISKNPFSIKYRK